MHNLSYLSNIILKYDLINKFSYKNIKKIPKLEKIILNFGCRTSEIRRLASSLLALELISNQKGVITTAKKANILLKVRKGNPTGCKVTLRKNNMLNFFSKITTEILPRMKNFDGFIIKQRFNEDAFSCELQDTFSFSELEEHYYLFNNLPKLKITFVTRCKNKKELIFLLKSFQFPIKS